MQQLTAIKMSIGKTVIRGELFENVTAKSLLDLLPLTVSLTPSNSSYYGGNLKLNYLSGDIQVGYKNGDLMYWIPGRNIVLFISGENYSLQVSDLVPIGRITDGIEKFKGFNQSINVKLEAVDF